MGAIELSNSVIAKVVGALGQGQRPVAIDRARIDRQLRDLALDHAAGKLVDEAYLERRKVLLASREEVETIEERGIAADRVVEWLRAIGETWITADVPEAKADVLHAIYERIVVTGRKIVSVRLTPSTYAHGFALALPEKAVLARPTGITCGQTVKHGKRPAGRRTSARSSICSVCFWADQ